VDAQTDVYSFGVVLYELLAGEVPYGGENFLSVAMKHVNEPVPSLLERRPDCPLRLAALVERCLAKEPSDRPASMDEVVGELQACLQELDSRPDGEATVIQRAPVAPAPRRREPGAARPRRAAPALVVLLGLLLVGAATAALLLTRGDENGGNGAQAAGNASVRLQGVASYDPLGDEAEHPEAVAEATDGDTATYWTTERYDDFAQTKQGVGLVLDAGEGDPSSFTIRSDTPGFAAEIRAGESAEGPFERVVSPSQTAAAETTWELEDGGARYYAVWITDMAPGSAVRINEVTAT